MFGVGLGELLIILILAFVLLGPEQMGASARKLLYGLGVLKRELDEATKDLRLELPTGEPPKEPPPDPALDQLETLPKPAQEPSAAKGDEPPPPAATPEA